MALEKKIFKVFPGAKYHLDALEKKIYKVFPTKSLLELNTTGP